jgi:hypothetical protein
MEFQGKGPRFLVVSVVVRELLGWVRRAAAYYAEIQG